MTLPSATSKAILSILSTAAAEGNPCPSNEALAGAVGLSCAATASYILVQQEKRGQIRIERTKNKRRLQVVSTGNWTAWTEPKLKRTADQQNSDDPTMAAAIYDPPIVDDPDAWPLELDYRPHELKL